ISAALRAISATRLSRAGIVARTESRIWSRIAILRFGIPSGNVNGDFGFSSRSGGIVSLTRKQRNILDYLTRAISELGYAPSLEEIAEEFGYQSLATVHEHLTNLERKGYIRRSYNESRSIEILPPRGRVGATEIPLLGTVAAGMPIESVMAGEVIS